LREEVEEEENSDFVTIPAEKNASEEEIRASFVAECMKLNEMQRLAKIRALH
jgi:hypothetical protein